MSPPAVVRVRRTLAPVTGRGASLEGDPACVARKRAVTQQPPDRGGVDIVGPRHIGLRLTRGEALHGFLPLMLCHLAGAAEPNAARLGALAALSRPGRISSRSNSAKPPKIVSISRPWGVVVSHHASLSDLKPAPRSATAAKMLSRSRVDRASRSRRVTTSVSSG